MNIEKILFYGVIIFVSVIIGMLILDMVIDIYWNHVYKLCDNSQIMANNVSKIVQGSTMVYFYCKR
jgi:hypothetical protein